jgi:3-isopropylmalate/(R)-2-methylmalate dehydratase large subunit
VEFCGEAVQALSMQERMTLCNMSAELGAQVGLVAPDETTREWLQAHGTVLTAQDLEQWSYWCSDPGAPAITHAFDAASLAPQVAQPHSPANVAAASELTDVELDVAYIGACTGAKLDDLAAAAQVLRGHRVAPGVQLLVAPASARDQREAERLGYMEVLRAAGARVLATSCGACAGYGGSIPDDANVISSTARNFKGRMGSATARVYLASPYTVAASALRGHVTDPREVLA